MANEEEVFDLGQEGGPAEEPFSYEAEDPNLVAAFKKHPEGMTALKRISMKCLDDFDRAWEATEVFRKNMADTWKLFAGTLDPKPPPLQHMANAHVPLLMENIIRMAYRQSNELFGNWTNVFGVTPIGPDDEHTAKLLSLHGNWQIRKRIKDFKRELGHRGLLIYDLFGDFTVHSYFDPGRKYNRHEVLTANEFVCANTHISTMPDYSDVSWVAKVVYMDGHELRKMDGSWQDVGSALKMLPPDWDDPTITRELREAVDKSLGVDSTAYERGQYRIIQYEGWLALPGQKRDRYCKVILDYQTHTILLLAIHERIDPYDKRRYEFQQQELQRFQEGMAELEAFQRELEQTQQSALSMSEGLSPALQAEGVLMARAVEEMPPPPTPPMPDWMRGDPNAVPAEPEYVPIRMFTHFVNIEPLQGIMGLGFGAILGPNNKAANILLTQHIDQATLNNCKNFLVGGDVRLPEKFELAPGKFHKMEGAIDLSKQVVPLEFGQANPQLMELIQLLIDFGQRSSNTPEVLSGEPGKSGETAQGLSARIEQATKMLSIPTGKYADSLSNVLENNAKINAVMMEDAEFFSVNNHDPSLGPLGRQTFNVGRELYDRPYDVEISADLKFTSTSQRISEADALVQLPNAVPALQTNYALLYEVIVKSLEARNRYDLIGKLGAPPEPPQMFGAPTSPPMPPPGAVPPPSPAPGGQAPEGPPQQGAPQ